MSFFQNLWADLVDKRLLPVVAVLIVGLVSVPLVLGREKEPDTPEPAEAIASVDDITSPGKVTLDPNSGPTFIQRQAKRRDPFNRKKVKVASSKAADAAKTVGDALGGAKAGGGTGGSSGGGGTSTTPNVPQPTVNRVTVQFGQSGNLKTYKNIEKLTPLPSEDNPLFVYTGIGENGKSATFLISTEAAPNGDGRCKPDAANCQTLALSAGETEFFDVPSGTGGMTQYELRVIAVTSKSLASKAK